MVKPRIFSTDIHGFCMSEEGLVFKEITHELIGCAYTVFNELKFGYSEKYYQRAYALELQKKARSFVREFPVPIAYQGCSIGRYMLDFLIDNKIIVEFKVGNDFSLQHVAQVLGYLKALNKKLALIILFSPHGVKVKRIIN